MTDDTTTTHDVAEELTSEESEIRNPQSEIEQPEIEIPEADPTPATPQLDETPEPLDVSEIQDPKSKIQTEDDVSEIQNPKSQIQNEDGVSEIQNPKSQIQNEDGVSEIQNPKSKIQNEDGVSEIQNPKSKIQNEDDESEIRNPQSEIEQSSIVNQKSTMLKLSAPRRELADAVSMAQQATRAGSPQNIFQNLKLEAKDGSLRVLGCDGEMWVERDIPCMIQAEGAACVQARLLSDIVTKLPDGDVTLGMMDLNGMLLQQGASEYRMLTLDAEDFPEPPDYGGEGELTMKMGLLRTAIDSVSYAVSTDMHRQILTGVLFNYDGATLTLVATDTHRLAVRKLAQPGLGSNITAVVPERALKAIKSLPLEDDDDVTIRFGVGRLGVDAGSAKVVSQILTGPYPNWERVVPSEWTRKWTVEADQMVDRVNRAMVVARDSANRVRFKGDGDQIVIAARSEEKGEAKEELPMVPQNGDVEIAFNGQYVLDAVRAMPGPGVIAEMTENSRPAIFRPADDETYFCVIMPMALA